MGLMMEISLNSMQAWLDQAWSRRSSSLNAASGFKMSYVVHLNAPNEIRVRRRYLLPQRHCCLIVHIAWHKRNPSHLLPPGCGVQLKYLECVGFIQEINEPCRAT